MRRKIFLGAVIVYIIMQVQINISCKKEKSCENCGNNPGNTNKPPTAIAGPDQVITLPSDSISLDGSASTDPDGTISNWLWTKVSGPASLNLISASASKTSVKNLVAGVYKFELKITDDKGASSRDTMTAAVNGTANRPPVAKAGADQAITLPVNSITLSGNGSTDPDNNITSYNWTKISGPSTFTFANSNAVQAQVTNLVQGVYQFELKVTDAGGVFSMDSIFITVNPAPPPPPACDNSNRPLINAHLIPVGTLSEPRMGISVAASGNKIVFAGGWNGNYRSSRADIFDISSNTITTAELCIGRDDMAAVAAGGKIFFGGGEIGDGTWPVDSVDIYDVATNTWSVSHLSSAGHSVAAATVGNKVFFAGGDHGFNGTPGIDRARQVDIYNLVTNTWSTAQLSNNKVVGHCGVTAGSKIYFSGGETWQGTSPVASNVIDIYDHASNSWSTSALLESRLGHTGVVLADKIYWAGGTPDCSVEIKDIITGNNSVQHLSKPGFWWQGIGQRAVIKNNKIILLRHSDTDPAPERFDIYDVITNTWSIGELPIDIDEFSIISVNNTIYLAGVKVNGVLSNQIWKLEF